MHRCRKFWIPVAVAALAAACGNYEELKNRSEVSAAAQPVSFAAVKSAILDPSCVSCHAGYARYPAVRGDLEAILSAVRSDRMPKGRSPLLREQRDLLETWARAGAPEVADQPPPAPVVLRPDWESVRDQILGPRCVVCHNPQGQARFLDLSTRQALFTARGRLFGGQALLDFDRPGDSYLITVILDDEEPMPPVWSNIRRLTDIEVKTLYEWISLGLP